MKKIFVIVLVLILKLSVSNAQPTDEVPDDPGFSSSTFGISNTSESSLKVYPVPSNGNFNVGFDNCNKKEHTIAVFDRNGRCVAYQKTMGTNVPFNLSSFPKGVYYVRLIDEVENAPVKVLIN